MKKGFTLVELSIVLVIIGLLIGGILVGQSLIDTVEVQKFVRTTQQFDAAIRTFKTKYKSLPGDSTIMPTPGDGNGLVDTNPEIENFWNDLAISGMRYKNKSSYDTDWSGGVFANVQVPDAIIDEEGITIITSFFPLTAERVNAYQFLESNRGPDGTIPMVATVAIDKKIDDGDATTGNMVSEFSVDLGLFTLNGFCDADQIASYSTSKCEIAIKIEE